MKCKLLLECNDNIRIAVDEENRVFIRTYGRGYKGDCWGSWHAFDFNPKSWIKLEPGRTNPGEDPSVWPIKQDVLDGLELLIDTTR